MRESQCWGCGARREREREVVCARVRRANAALESTGTKRRILAFSDFYLRQKLLTFERLVATPTLDPIRTATMDPLTLLPAATTLAAAMVLQPHVATNICYCDHGCYGTWRW